MIDTGVNYNHFAIRGAIRPNTGEIPGNGIDDDGNGFIDDNIGYDFSSSDPFPFDDDGHGTHVAGLAASPLFGVAKSADILPIKVMTGLGVDMGSFVGAMLYAVDERADVINASFGWQVDHEFFRHSVEYAKRKGTIVVAAAGNGDQFGRGFSNDGNPSYPCSYDYENVISVAATDEYGQLTPYSNYGKDSVHVATFGGRSNQPMLSAAKYNNIGMDMTALYGTSQATPIVAGTVAVLLAKDPSLTPREVRELLVQTSAHSPDLRQKIRAPGPIDIEALLGRPLPRP